MVALVIFWLELAAMAAAAGAALLGALTLVRARAEALCRQRQATAPSGGSILSYARGGFRQHRWASWAGLTAGLLPSAALAAAIGFLAWRLHNSDESRWATPLTQAAYARIIFLLWLLLALQLIVLAWWGWRCAAVAGRRHLRQLQAWRKRGVIGVTATALLLPLTDLALQRYLSWRLETLRRNEMQLAGMTPEALASRRQRLLDSAREISGLLDVPAVSHMGEQEYHTGSLTAPQLQAAAARCRRPLATAMEEIEQHKGSLIKAVLAQPAPAMGPVQVPDDLESLGALRQAMDVDVMARCLDGDVKAAIRLLRLREMLEQDVLRACDGATAASMPGEPAIALFLGSVGDEELLAGAEQMWAMPDIPCLERTLRSQFVAWFEAESGDRKLFSAGAAAGSPFYQLVVLPEMVAVARAELQREIDDVRRSTGADLIPKLREDLPRVDELAAQRLAWQAGLTAARFRLRQGRWPRTTGELASAGLHLEMPRAAFVDEIIGEDGGGITVLIRPADDSGVTAASIWLPERARDRLPSPPQGDVPPEN